MAKSELHRDYVLELENELQEFEMKAETSTKRMQMLVYPAMIAFFILSAFGFYLIYTLTSDVNRMANTISHMSGSIDTNMTSISDTMVNMSNDVGKMTNTTVEMSDTISGMTPAINDMAASTNNMQRDFWSLNKNISTPLGFMNDFLPWKNSQSLPFQGSKAPLPPSYYAHPAQQQQRAIDYGATIPMPIQMPSISSPASSPATNYPAQPEPKEVLKPDTHGSAIGSNASVPVSAFSMQ